VSCVVFNTNSNFRFMDCEKWREDTKLDDQVPSWDFHEKAQMFEYYPQYYHKTDIVMLPLFMPSSPLLVR